MMEAGERRFSGSGRVPGPFLWGDEDEGGQGFDHRRFG